MCEKSPDGVVQSLGARSNGFDWFKIQSIDEKIRTLPTAVEAGLRSETRPRFDFQLGRDLRVVQPADLPDKPGLSSPEGQARLFHDLASIELQAMELAVRGLFEFPDAPSEFRQQLAEVALSEGQHLELCLRQLRDLGFRWGHWDAHIALWQTVSDEDQLLDRVLIVHRYLEGSGLDAGESILRRLSGIGSKIVRSVVQTIVDEEIGHVEFGSRWYRKLAQMQGLDAEEDFRNRIGAIALMAPRRERIARDLRLRAGFTESEIRALQDVQL